MDGGVGTPNVVTFEVGRIVGDYQLVDVLGSGGEGDVYVAVKVRGASNGRKWALKTRVCHSHDDLNFGLREAYLMASLNSKYVCDVLEVFVVPHESIAGSHRLCIVLELCANGDVWSFIRGRIEDGNPVGAETICLWIHDLVQGLCDIHEHGLGHFDVKVENLFLTDECRLKLGDFGLAESVRLGKLTEKPQGTYEYMAPEQLKRDPYTNKADIWSVGLAMFEMCTRRCLAEHGTCVAEEANAGGWSTRSLLSKLPTELRHIGSMIHSCLNRDPSLRPSARALLHDECMAHIVSLVTESSSERGHSYEVVTGSSRSGSLSNVDDSDVVDGDAAGGCDDASVAQEAALSSRNVKHASEPGFVTRPCVNKDAVAALLGQTMTADPRFRSVLAIEPTLLLSLLRKCWARSVVRHCTKRGNHLWGVHTRTTHELVAAAVWIPPDYRKEVLRQHLRVPKQFALLANKLFRFTRVVMSEYEAEMAEPSWFLWWLVVTPEFRGRGFGRNLLSKVLAWADEDGVSCGTVCFHEAHVEYFARFGFRCVSKVGVTMRKRITVSRTQVRSSSQWSSRDPGSADAGRGRDTSTTSAPGTDSGGSTNVDAVQEVVFYILKRPAPRRHAVSSLSSLFQHQCNNVVAQLGTMEDEHCVHPPDDAAWQQSRLRLETVDGDTHVRVSLAADQAVLGASLSHLELLPYLPDVPTGFALFAHEESGDLKAGQAFLFACKTVELSGAYMRMLSTAKVATLLAVEALTRRNDRLDHDSDAATSDDDSLEEGSMAAGTATAMHAGKVRAFSIPSHFLADAGRGSELMGGVPPLLRRLSLVVPTYVFEDDDDDVDADDADDDSSHSGDDDFFAHSSVRRRVRRFSFPGLPSLSSSSSFLEEASEDVRVGEEQSVNQGATGALSDVARVQKQRALTVSSAPLDVADVAMKGNTAKKHPESPRAHSSSPKKSSRGSRGSVVATRALSPRQDHRHRRLSVSVNVGDISLEELDDAISAIDAVLAGEEEDLVSWFARKPESRQLHSSRH